ncbi:hypothetical protein SAMN05443287_1096 [Micromonospora phaseoli]|uniref:4-amino-4-deoxy-L-arabinose transferase n=1 Tax=Micromonospora phaseoli TaxID=1144548 RepID=A0A1H7C998_9ACTN|nr:hypothetical protein CLV64_105248 [Micromonospora phaseoli]GIJ81218.1 hypothetical protein Xph01_56500 [Micromonospora phaseoli]SEJ86443.1 hypothetical protein SAMN05443287_1096 [Micromonospora phaseoli]
MLAALVVSLLLAVAFLLAPPMGTDLSAQVARAGFADRNGLAPLDFSWYGGVNQFGYSLYTQTLGAHLGVRTVGAVAAVVAAVALAWLLTVTGARRPLLGGVLGAVVLVGNLASGRITFAVGLMWALLALCAVAAPRGPRGLWLSVAGVAAVLATAASPVAGLFTGLAGGALLVLDIWRDRRPGTAGLVLCLAPLVTVAPMAVLFGNGGRQPFSAESLRINLALAVVVLALVPVRALRIGAALTALLLVAAYHLPSPIGSNALRLPMLFALPVLAAYVTLRRRWLAALLVVLFWWQSPVMTNDIARRGSAPVHVAFYRPLLAELDRRAPVGRVEVVPLRDHWESGYVAEVVPLARGWERQADAERNALFYGDGLDAQRYGEWLHHNAVSYVAVAPDAALDRYARDEATLVLAGQPYLREVGRPGQWRLYEVLDSEPLVSRPARLVRSDDAGVRFTVDAPTDVLVRVRWSRWLSLAEGDGCLRPGSDEWVTVAARTPGIFQLTSSLRPSGHC